MANSLAAIEAGARQVECAVNGIGERAGNAALEEIVMALRTRADFFDGLDTGIKTEELARTSRLVSRLTGYPVQYNKAVVGRNAFAHEAGIHQHGVLTKRETYEIMDPAAVGQGESQIVLGQTLRPSRVLGPAPEAGLRPQRRCAQRRRSPGSRSWPTARSSSTTPISRRWWPRSWAARSSRRSSWCRSTATAASTNTPTATVVIEHGGERVETSAEGDGMVDAACKAIKEATGIDGRLTDYTVTSVTGGVDALADVALRFEAEGLSIAGRGLSTDVVEASARAFVNATNRVVRVKESGEDRWAVDRPGHLPATP